MKIQLISFISLFSAVASLSAQASTVEMPVIERVGKNGYRLVDRPITDLESNTAFVGKHFKIVVGKGEKPISFQDPEFGQRAANVYYHLTKARAFWIDVLKSDYVKQMDRMTVRLGITNQFSKIAHFKNDNLEPQYNNAFTIPAGHTPDWLPEDKQKSWGMEIWFTPMKKVSSKELAENAGENPLEAALSNFQGPVVDYTFNSFSQSSLNHIFYPNNQSGTYLESVIRHAGTLALTYGIVKASRRMDSLFMEDFYYLDTAMIPEIIYHEFAHAALSDRLEPTHATAVIEGMADYFAALTADRTDMYREIKGFSNNLEKNALNKTLYHPYLENSWNATGDYVLSLLWKVKEELSAPGLKRMHGQGFPSRIVHNAANHLSTKDSTINKDLTRALVDSCKDVCDPRAQRLVISKLLKVFEEKGL